ncbi:transcriptional regulator [Oceanobacillus picturae]|uniref:Transcriptional regulator n=2 Tax=Oceanobacillus TaxID=182709 RepID=A0A0U9HID4_9BACI|nr:MULTISPECIES: metalloregulator ArsR/SmtB family transcription factor [Oceanobacillus]AVQ98062.1 transcriptional regulator [Oceanobacillus iheyensis]MCG3421107.1 helix-turn-helix domain-containing protein [Oceanobacillus jordanicus]GAQ19542.1 transcriptional regulator [Oceanobacillus picturae]
METIDVFKALSNKTRLNILQWLKEPEKHFPKQGAHLPKEVSYKGGVCVGDIQEKAEASQSTVSHYLNMMQKAGLLESVRYGQWTYYRRNEEAIHQFTEFLKTEI